MTRRQIIAAIAALVSGSTLVRARQEKKTGELATVTLIIDGMT